MDFIELFFGFSPDDGSGLFELAIFLVLLLGIVGQCYRRLRRQRVRDLRERSYDGRQKRPIIPS